MNNRVLWFVAGTAACIYTSYKARRVAYRLTPSGVSDQAGALGVGIRAFADEVRAGMAERETRIADELGLTDPANPTNAHGRRPPNELESKDIR